MSQSGMFIPNGGGGGGGVVLTLTGNSGGAVGATANNINVVGTGSITVTGNPGTSTLTISSSGGSGVTSITGTANEITASASTGAVTLSTPSTFIGPGSVAATTNFILPTSSSTAGKIIVDSSTFMIGQTSVLSTFLGRGAGNTTLSGSSNTALGYASGASLNTASASTFVGADAGNTVTAGAENTGIGASALNGGDLGSYNTAIGSGAAGNATKTTSFTRNVAVGRSAGLFWTSATDNIAIGYVSLLTTSGSNNVAIGSNAGSSYVSTESNNIVINSTGTASESNVLRIGSATGTGTQQLNSAFIAGITGIVVTGSPALISTGNQLGVAASSARFKENIRDMASESSPIMAMRPVTFNFKQEIDANKSKSFGLIAEEVYKVLPELVELDKGLEPFSVKYHEMPALLLNEIQKLNKRIQALEDTIRG